MRVYAERHGKRIHVQSPYSTENVRKAKSIKGARWSKAERVWTYPLDIEVCRRLRKVWGDALHIGPELWAWAAAERTKEEVASKLLGIKDLDAILKDFDLPRVKAVAPRMYEAMLTKPFQLVGARYMIETGRALNGDQPGIGKTIQSIAALVEQDVQGGILILAPLKSTVAVWEPEIHKWLADQDVNYTVTRASGLTPTRRQAALDAHAALVAADPSAMHFLICNAEMCRIKKTTACPAKICDGDEDWCPQKDKHKNTSETRIPHLFNREWEAIVADETHKWLINTRGNSASQVGYGFTKLRSVEGSPRYSLSGTPLKGKKYNLFGTLNWERPDVYTSKWRWIESYFDTQDGDYGGKLIGDLLEEEREAFFRSLDSIMIRRTKRELHDINPDWMPPHKIYHDVYVDMDPKQKRAYDAMLSGARVELASGTLEANGELAEMTRLKQFASCYGDLKNGVFQPEMPSGKFDWLLEFMEERGIESCATVHYGKGNVGDLSDDVRKIVVASQFTKFINLWAAELVHRGIQCFVITGETKERDALQYVERFQNEDDVRVVLLNTMAGGVSITLDAADDVVLMDETWVPDDQEQVEDRVHRASRTDHQVDVWYVRSKDTIEEDIAMANIDKAENNHVTLDARRALEFARQAFATTIREKKK